MERRYHHRVKDSATEWCSAGYSARVSARAFRSSCFLERDFSTGLSTSHSLVARRCKFGMPNRAETKDLKIPEEGRNVGHQKWGPHSCVTKLSGSFRLAACQCCEDSCKTNVRNVARSLFFMTSLSITFLHFVELTLAHHGLSIFVPCESLRSPLLAVIGRPLLRKVQTRASWFLAAKAPTKLLQQPDSAVAAARRMGLVRVDMS